MAVLVDGLEEGRSELLLRMHKVLYSLFRASLLEGGQQGGLLSIDDCPAHLDHFDVKRAACDCYLRFYLTELADDRMGTWLGSNALQRSCIFLLEFLSPSSARAALLGSSIAMRVCLVMLVDQLVSLEQHLKHGMLSAKLLRLLVGLDLVGQGAADGPAHVDALQVSGLDLEAEVVDLTLEDLSRACHEERLRSSFVV